MGLHSLLKAERILSLILKYEEKHPHKALYLTCFMIGHPQLCRQKDVGVPCMTEYCCTMMLDGGGEKSSVVLPVGTSPGKI